MDIKSHWGLLLKRWLYALGIVALGVGLAFVCQYYWQVQWYIVLGAIGGLAVLSMGYNTLSTLRTRVRHTPDGDGIVVEDGAIGRRIHTFRYARMLSYAIRPSRYDDLVGCTTVVLCAYVGATDKEEYTLCLAKADADILLADLEQHLQQTPHA